MSKRITKAVIPAAGFGTRFLPWTKAMPKEMLPIVDKPVIQHVVEEAVEAGIEDIIIVTGWNKRAIEDHFDYPFELIQKLKESGKEDKLAEVERAANLANFIYIRQKGPTGNAIPIYNARKIIGNEPFLVLWGDDFFSTEKKNRSQQLIEAYQKYGSTVISGMRIQGPEDTKKYGMVAGNEIEPGVFKITEIVEKPGPEKAPSDMALAGGFIAIPEIFDCIKHMIENEIKGPGGEYVYVDAFNLLRERGHDIHAVEIQDGIFYDTGTKIEYMKTITELALQHPEIGEAYREYLKEIILD